MSINIALAAQRKRLAEKQEGFTLIELLVVVIIIGILAAIAIPVFLGQQDAARDAQAESNLATAKVAYVSSLVNEDTPTQATLDTFGWPGDTVTIVATGSSFCLTAVGANDTTWQVDSSTAAPAPGSCA